MESSDGVGSKVGITQNLVRSASTSAQKPRTAWCPVILKCLKGHELHILWQDARGNLKLFKHMKSKEPFGRILKSEIVTVNNAKQEMGEYYQMSNEYRDAMNFKVIHMNPSLVGDNSFSKKLVELKLTEGQGDKMISSFLSRLSYCKEFSHHDSYKFSPLGLKQEEVDEVKNEFEVFLKEAIENATTVTSSKADAINIIANKTKKKKVDPKPKAKPLNKQERIDKYYLKEISDPKGVEREHIQKMRGRADIDLDKLEVCSRVLIPIDQMKVKLLAKEMHQKYDPSACILTAVPKEDAPFDEDNLPGNLYEIVHGRHRLLALKLLKSEGKLKDLIMMEEGVTCYILGASSLSGVNFAYMRGQDIQSKFNFAPNHHELVHIINGMKEVFVDASKVMEVVTRYANILKLSDAMKAALRQICKWPTVNVEILVTILVKYQNYQTADSDFKTMKKNNAKLMKGEKLIMPINLFKEVAKFPQDYLTENSASVLSGAVAVKELVAGFTSAEVRRKKEALIIQSSGHQTIENLRTNFPKMFTQEIIDKLPTSKTASSDKTIECYTKSVIENKKSDPRESLNHLKTIELNQDLQEVKSFHKQAKRAKVKEALEYLVKNFEGKLTDQASPGGSEVDQIDPYKFDEEKQELKYSDIEMSEATGGRNLYF